jgi:hypothetical protein
VVTLSRKAAFVAALIFSCLAFALFPTPSTAQTPGLRGYAGQWVCKYENRNLIVLTLQYANGRLAGVMSMPKHFQMEQGGEISHISSEVGVEEVEKASIVGGHLEFVTKRNNDENQFSMRLIGSDRASLGLIGIPLQPWELARVIASEKAVVATDWPQQGPRTVTKDIAALQAQLKRMYDQDQAVRLAEPLSDLRMNQTNEQINQIDKRNYPQLLRIYQKYGLPRISVVGSDAAGEFWLLVQHQDSHLDFQKQVLQDMKGAVEQGEASKANYAYLYDRVMVNEQKPQHWGTQISCKNGKPVLDPVDDPSDLEKRRQELQLMPLDKYLAMLAPNCKDSAAGTSPTKKVPRSQP